MAEIIPFPQARNRRRVAGLARRLLRMNPDTAERHIKARVAEELERMLSRGVRGDIAAAATMEFEGAIRAELWRVVLAPGGAA